MLRPKCLALRYAEGPALFADGGEGSVFGAGDTLVMRGEAKPPSFSLGSFFPFAAGFCDFLCDVGIELRGAPSMRGANLLGRQSQRSA
jgi:hypothetical protein